MPILAKKVCKIEGCLGEHVAKGFCNKHYLMQKKHKDPLYATDEKRFWRKVKRNLDNDCWEWEAGLFPNGYGQFSIGKKGMGAHRYAYGCAKGEIPDGLYVCHHCDNKKCVNPNHLFLGTPLENIQDYDSKHNRKTPKGEKSHSSKLTAKEVSEIRLLKHKLAQHKIAKRYGISQTQVSRILNNLRW